jgi:conjugal transfer pilus assembly protein TraF
MLAIVISALLVLPGGAEAQEATSGAGKPPAGKERFLNDRERGWHWYEVEPEEVETPEQMPETGPPPMSVPWLRAEFEKATEAAVENPTRERVEYWAYLKKILLDKSEKFARMAMQVNEVNPVLDETIQNPVQTAVRNAASLDAKEKSDEVLTSLSQQVGLIYFYKSDCSFCGKQNDALDTLMRLYGFRVTAVSLDRRQFPTGHFPDWIPDGGQAAKLGVNQTPTLYLFKPPGQMVLLSVGAQSTSSLESRILSSAKRANWIDEATFERAVLGMERRYFLDKITAPGAIDWSDPSKALEALKAVESSAAVDADLGDQGFETNEATPWTGEAQ